MPRFTGNYTSPTQAEIEQWRSALGYEPPVNFPGGNQRPPADVAYTEYCTVLNMSARSLSRCRTYIEAVAASKAGVQACEHLGSFGNPQQDTLVKALESQIQSAESRFGQSIGHHTRFKPDVRRVRHDKAQRELPSAMQQLKSYLSNIPGDNTEWQAFCRTAASVKSKLDILRPELTDSTYPAWYARWLQATETSKAVHRSYELINQNYRNQPTSGSTAAGGSSSNANSAASLQPPHQRVAAIGGPSAASAPSPSAKFYNVPPSNSTNRR